MAVTKIKPIRGTVNKALTYILDPQKTDDAFYVSSYGCAASDAAAKEFEWTRNLAVQQGMQMPKVLARHLIQSFDIGEVTPEEAHEVGKQLADEWLKGKYEYVIATHIDKGHCHNHIIFNAVNYVDFHAYRSNRRTYRELRQLSDEICKEHGLSVIPPSQNKGMDYKEYTEAKRGTSWKQKLKQTIDRLVITAKDYAQCNNGALLYELFCCIKSIKKSFDEQCVLPSFPCNVEAVLRNKEIYKADLRYEKPAGDIERFELLGVAPAMKRSIAVADCLSHFNDGQQIAVLTKLVFHIFSEAGSFLFGHPRQLIPIGDTRIVMT